MSIPHHSTHATQLVDLFSKGVTPIEISRALGITPGAVTQLMAHPDVAPQISEIRAAQIARSSALDARYDSLEEKLVTQLEKSVALILKPQEIAKTIVMINGLKRRGAAHAPELGPQNQVTLQLAPQILQRFVTNTHNQVVSVGGQTLITMQSSNIPKLAEANHAPPPTPTPQIQPNQIQLEQEDEFGFTYPIASNAAR